MQEQTPNAQRPTPTPPPPWTGSAVASVQRPIAAGRTEATASISSNLAEGSSRASRIDFARFVEIATGSLFEIVSQSTIALRRKMITQTSHDQIYAAAEKQSKMLSGLRKSLAEI